MLCALLVSSNEPGIRPNNYSPQPYSASEMADTFVIVAMACSVVKQDEQTVQKLNNRVQKEVEADSLMIIKSKMSKRQILWSIRTRIRFDKRQ